MATVYVAHEQKREDRDGNMVPAYDTSAAEEFGMRRVVFPHETHLKTPEEQIRIARAAMADISAEDWLVFCGAPDMSICAALVMAELTDGLVNLLLFDRRINRYVPRRYDLMPNHPNRK